MSTQEATTNHIHPAPPRRGFLCRWFMRLVLLIGLVGVAGVMYFGWQARQFDLERLGVMPARSVVYDAKEREIGKLHGENRVIVSIKEVSPFFIKALIAREDRRFYRHGGVDYLGVIRALVRDLKDRKFTQGASTLTMQLARNSYGLSRKSLHRKLTEIALAWRIEDELNKERILELYVNRIFFGAGVYGIERASQIYFGKSAKDLDEGESAMLAAIIRGPNKFSPHKNYAVALSGRNMVIDDLVESGEISREDGEKFKAKKTAVKAAPQTSNQESYAMDAVRRELDRLLDAEDVEDGGLKIYTTLDLDLQKASEAALQQRLAKIEKTPGYEHETKEAFLRKKAQNPLAVPNYLQGSVVVIENETGAIKSLVGGRDFQDSVYHRAMLSSRPVGSTFKPFVYAAGLQTGIYPSTLIDDGPVEVDGWKPKNSDGSFRGLQPMAYGLAKSRNTMTVRIGERAGRDRVVELAERLGFTVPMGNDGPSAQIYLGNLDATLLALTSAYTSLPNAGERALPHLIERIEFPVDTEGFLGGQQSYPVMTAGAAYLVTQMLQKVFSEGTATSARSLGWKDPAAGKTGTTDDYRDAWFIGYHHRLTCGVWVGLDQPERVVSQGYGARLALPIWVDVMLAAKKGGLEGGDPLPAVEVEECELCAVTGQRATSGCRRAQTAVKAEVPTDLLRHALCDEHTGSGIPRAEAVKDEAPAEESSGGFWQRVRGWLRD